MDGEQLFKFLKKQKKNDLLEFLQSSFNYMDTEQRRSVFGKFYNQIEPGRINGKKLLQKIQKFEKASLIDLLFKFISSIRWSEEDKRDIFFCHKKIAEKVEQKDPKGARKAMLEHLGDMGRILYRYPMKDVLE